MEQVSVRRFESYFSGEGGRVLFRRAWIPPEPRRLFVLIHGYGEHSGRYDHVGAWFAARRCAVHAFDQRGHGRSDGVRCHVRRFGDLLDDLEQVLDRARAEHPELPCFLVGHSMGGLVAVAYALERQPDLAGIVTSGAALSVGARFSALRILGFRLLRTFAPRLSLASGLDPEGLSTNPDVVRAYCADPLVQTRMTLSFAVAFFDAARRSASRGAGIALPMLALHGRDDPICPAWISEAFAGAVPRGRFRIYDGMRHEVFNEPESEAVFQDVLSWMCERDVGA
jgi:alpha-beta hydrolase superfamily lysophospholipase